jgi:hypothetical protein
VSAFPLGLADEGFFALQATLESYPNPVSETATVRFNLAKEQNLSLSVHDLTGREAGRLFTQKKYAAGAHEVKLDNAVLHLPAGLYFLQLSNGRASETCKLVLR